MLAGNRGPTLYYYAEDKPGSGTSACTGSCASAWPPLAAPARAPAGMRLPGPLGMISRPGGGSSGHHQRLSHLHLRRGQGPGAGRRQRDRRRLARHQGLTRGVLGAQFGFQQVHRLEEGGLLAGGELVEDPGERAGLAPSSHCPTRALWAGAIAGDRPPAVRGVGVPVHQPGPVQVGDDAADGGQRQAQPGGELTDGDRALAQLLERGHGGVVPACGVGATAPPPPHPRSSAGTAHSSRRHSAECAEPPASSAMASPLNAPCRQHIWFRLQNYLASKTNPANETSPPARRRGTGPGPSQLRHGFGNVFL